MIWGTYESKEHRTVEEKMRKTLIGRDAKKGTYNGNYTYCTVNAYGDCPYCDQCGVCHIDDPIEDCDDFAAFFENWDEWLNCDDVDPNVLEDSVDETGYNPYEGAYDYDC